MKLLFLKRMLAAWNRSEREKINENWTDIERGFSAANTAINTAQETAEDGVTRAKNAQATADDATKIANGIDGKATEALNKSNQAVNTSNTARDTAQQAKTTAEATARQINDAINEMGDTNTEVIASRTNTTKNITYITLGERVDTEISALEARQPHVHPIVQDLIGKRKIMAHRCAYFRLPENTLAAFYEATRMGIKYFETDFRRTIDGHHVCIHDGTTARTSSTDLTIATSTLAEVLAVRQDKLAKAAFYDNPPTPTLDDVLEFMRKTGAIVNLNFDYGISDADIPAVIQKIYEHNVQEQVILAPRFLAFDNKLCTTQTLPLTDEAFADARKKGNVIAAYDYGYGSSGYLQNAQWAMALASKHDLPVLTWTTTNYDVFLALDKLNVNMMMVDDLWLRKDDVK